MRKNHDADRYSHCVIISAALSAALVKRYYYGHTRIRS
jgi:hypothetical protein